MLVYQANPVEVQFICNVNTFFCPRLVYQGNPVGVLLFSYVNTFFCHVGVPSQSCESSTLLLCKHFLLPCWRTKQISWESTLLLCKHFLLFQLICMAGGHVSENAL